MTKEQQSAIIGIVISAVIALLAVFGYNVVVVQPQLAAIEQTQDKLLLALQGLSVPEQQGLVGQDVTGFNSVDVANDLAVGDDLTVAGDATLANQIVEMTTTHNLNIQSLTPQPSPTPGLRINVLGVNAPLSIEKASTPVASISNVGNATFSGVVSAAGPSVFTAPTSVPTAQPAFKVNSTGVSRLFEVQKAATPVASIDGTGNLAASGTGTFGGAIYGYVPVSAKSSSYPVTVADVGTFFKTTNAITLTLPGAVAGLEYCVVNYDGADLTLAFTDATDVAYNEVNSPGDRVTNTTAGDNICLVAMDTTNWYTISSLGTWADGN